MTQKSRHDLSAHSPPFAVHWTYFPPLGGVSLPDLKNGTFVPTSSGLLSVSSAVSNTGAEGSVPSLVDKLIRRHLLIGKKETRPGLLLPRDEAFSPAELN
jgi:hypothetical protein